MDISWPKRWKPVATRKGEQYTGPEDVLDALKEEGWSDQDFDQLESDYPL